LTRLRKNSEWISGFVLKIKLVSDPRGPKMSINLENIDFETLSGTWRSTYMKHPNEPSSSDEVEYRIRFKWIDPNNPDNKATPERLLTLLTYHIQTQHPDYEEKLKEAIVNWLSYDIETDAMFDRDAPVL
jgi:hypothetical protein